VLRNSYAVRADGGFVIMDEIIAEVRKIREEYAAEHNYDLDEIFKDLKREEASSSRRFVDLRQKRKN
jgi:predicted metal-dependent hydrolase